MQTSLIVGCPVWVQISQMSFFISRKPRIFRSLRSFWCQRRTWFGSSATWCTWLRNYYVRATRFNKPRHDFPIHVWSGNISCRSSFLVLAFFSPAWCMTGQRGGNCTQTLWLAANIFRVFCTIEKNINVHEEEKNLRGGVGPSCS